MKRPPFIATTLAIIYFLLALNAYACLVPLYGGVKVAQGSDCTMPQEQPARQHCDAFKSIGVQTLSSADPLLDCHSQVVVGEQVSGSILDSVLSHHYALLGSPPFLERDPLSLTSILRI
jgi:hypothetical protein